MEDEKMRYTLDEKEKKKYLLLRMEGNSDFSHNTGWPIKAHQDSRRVLFARVLSFLESTK